MKEIAAPLEDLNISYFTFTRVENSGARIYLSNTPETLETYFKKGYYRVGNIEGDPSKYPAQTVLWDTLPNQYIYNEIPRQFNIDHGMFIVDPHETYCDFYGLATKKGNDRIINTYLSSMEELKKFTESFTERADEIIQNASENKIILPFNQNIDDYHFTQDATSGIQLSARQVEISRALLQGKTIKETAKLLQLSPRTVESYLNILKEKLHCHNKTTLIMALMKIL